MNDLQTLIIELQSCSARINSNRETLQAKLARAHEIIEKQREAIDLLIGEIDQCCDVTDQPTNEAISFARAALAITLDEPKP